MKILLLNHNVVWIGGTFFRAFLFGRELVRCGHNVSLLSISRNRWLGFDVESRDGVTVIGFPDLLWGRGRTGWDGWDTLRRVLRVRRLEWDVVHAFDSNPAVILPALAVRAPLVLDWADWWGRGGTIEERATGAAVRTLIGPVETWFEICFGAWGVPAGIPGIRFGQWDFCVNGTSFTRGYPSSRHISGSTRTKALKLKGL